MSDDKPDGPFPVDLANRPHLVVLSSETEMMCVLFDGNGSMSRAHAYAVAQVGERWPCVQVAMRYRTVTTPRGMKLAG